MVRMRGICSQSTIRAAHDSLKKACQDGHLTFGIVPAASRLQGVTLSTPRDSGAAALQL